MNFKIVKKGKLFVAFDLVDKKRSYGKIHMDTGRFIGDTRCLVELSKFQETYKEETYKQEIVDKVLEEIKKDVADGDMTAIEELLKFLPIKNLKDYLPEVLDKRYKYKINYSREVIVLGKSEDEAKDEFKDDYIFDEIISIKKVGD